MIRENQFNKEKIELLLENLRSGKGVDRKTSHDLVVFNNANYLRNLLTDKDLIWIKNLLTSEYDEHKELAICIIQPLQNNPGIKNLLLSLWKQKISLLVQNALIYRLLDYSDLETNYHEIIMNWVSENKEAFKNIVVEWYKGVENVVNLAQSRLANPNFPDSKKWIYLIQIAWLGDSEIARKIIKPYTRHNIEFVAKVAKELLMELDNK